MGEIELIEIEIEGSKTKFKLIEISLLKDSSDNVAGINMVFKYMEGHIDGKIHNILYSPNFKIMISNDIISNMNISVENIESDKKNFLEIVKNKLQKEISLRINSRQKELYYYWMIGMIREWFNFNKLL